MATNVDAAVLLEVVRILLQVPRFRRAKMTENFAFETGKAARLLMTFYQQAEGLTKDQMRDLYDSMAMEAQGDTASPPDQPSLQAELAAGGFAKSRFSSKVIPPAPVHVTENPAAPGEAEERLNRERALNEWHCQFATVDKALRGFVWKVSDDLETATCDPEGTGAVAFVYRAAKN